mmetsp:Transcript_16267/g.30605  ORF Transcript_16267/g.30605 Transcript_16267/m.30605 type:complete len:383 (+) Transcript_16267:31-1179(+)
MDPWQRFKNSGLPALLAMPALLWLAMCCTALQALCMLLWAAGLRKEYTVATRFLVGVMHRPMLYLMEYSGTRVYVYGEGDVQAKVLKTLGYNQSLIFSNHRGDLDWLIGLLVEDNGGGLGCAKAMVKQELVFLPLFGFSWWAADFICINRNWQSDRRRLDAGYRRQHDYRKWEVPYTLTIFPEGTRLTPGKLRDSQEFCNSKGYPRLENSLCPRAKGLWSAINGMQLDCVYDITVVQSSDTDKANVLTLAQGVAAEFHVHVQTLDPKSIPAEEDSFQKWLLERWVAKDAQIARFLKDGHLGGDRGTDGRHLLSVSPACRQTLVGAIVWFNLCTSIFVRWCVASGYYGLLTGAGIGTVLLMLITAVVVHQVHFTHSAQGKKSK